MTIYAIDPGQEHTGIALQYGIMTTCLTLPPWEAVSFLNGRLTTDDQVVMENWVPYPDTPSNAYRDLIEAKILGAIEWICRQRRTPYCYQQTSILVPTQALADSRGYQWAARDRDQKAAETHLYHHMYLKG